MSINGAAHKNDKKQVFIDVFAGCGGLSLGLMQAGFDGLFAVEQDRSAFDTLQSNLVRKDSKYRFCWPSWLEEEAHSIEKLLQCHAGELKQLRGHVDLVAGGPPCQGFSSAGRRRQDDPRNQLFKAYIEFVRMVKPRALLIENVKGFTLDFKKGHGSSNYASKLRSILTTDYNVYEELIDLSQFGVPQSRTRYFVIALRCNPLGYNPFEVLQDRKSNFLRSIGLNPPISSWSAISDLETTLSGTRPSTETKGFQEICYAAPRTGYQKLVASEAAPTDLRLARHRPETVERFEEFIELSHADGRLNTTISEELRQRFGIKKRAFRVLDPDRPAPTITSMPDDLLHYKEPRTLTVRENARLQGFPDWFAFKGNYTTGGHRRRHEVPRYTQVANAVPPIMARAIGDVLIEFLSTGRDAASLVRSTQEPVQIPELGP